MVLVDDAKDDEERALPKTQPSQPANTNFVHRPARCIHPSRWEAANAKVRLWSQDKRKGQSWPSLTSSTKASFGPDMVTASASRRSVRSQLSRNIWNVGADVAVYDLTELARTIKPHAFCRTLPSQLETEDDSEGPIALHPILEFRGYRGSNDETRLVSTCKDDHQGTGAQS